MNSPPMTPISVTKAFEKLTFLGDRTPLTTADESADAFAALSPYRNGSVFIGHYAGNSQWERHPNGDEFVFVVDGHTRLFMLIDGDETENTLGPGEFLVVPENTWHRFETPDGVKIMTITPQPTDHSVERPE